MCALELFCGVFALELFCGVFALEMFCGVFALELFREGRGGGGLFGVFKVIFGV